ncbi:MAG: hypothetical protein ABIR24_12160 [Verrucomicrobiota bacterium]
MIVGRLPDVAVRCSRQHTARFEPLESIRQHIRVDVCVLMNVVLVVGFGIELDE